MSRVAVQRDAGIIEKPHEPRPAAVDVGKGLAEQTLRQGLHGAEPLAQRLDERLRRLLSHGQALCGQSVAKTPLDLVELGDEFEGLPDVVGVRGLGLEQLTPEVRVMWWSA